MLFDPPNVRLAAFTNKYRRKRSLADIPRKDLRTWKKLTQQTLGRYLLEYMAPARWSDSVASLQTALAIVMTHIPAELADGDPCTQTIRALRRRILTEISRSPKARNFRLSRASGRK